MNQPVRTDAPITSEQRVLSDLYDALSFLAYRLSLNNDYDCCRDKDVMEVAAYALRQAEVLAPGSLFIGGPNEEMATYEVEVKQVVAVHVPINRFDLAHQLAKLQANAQAHWDVTVYNDHRSLLPKAEKFEPLTHEVMRHGRNILDRLKNRNNPTVQDLENSPPEQ